MELSEEDSLDSDSTYRTENVFDDLNATMSFEQPDLEFEDETVVDSTDEEDVHIPDRSVVDEDVEIDGYRAISAGDRTPWRTENAAELMFELSREKSERLLKLVPYQVQKNASFMVSLSALKCDDDILADSNGRWLGGRGKRETQFVEDEDTKRVSVMVEGEGIKFVRRCYQNQKVRDYKRVIVICTELRMAFIQYYFKHGQERSFTVDSHKNAKNKAPYDRLQESTRKRIAELTEQGKKPRQIHEQILKEIGGTSGVQTTAGIPSMKAIYNHIANTKATGLDDFHALILRCIKEAGTPAAFIRQVCVAPSFMVMLANDRQLNDFVRFSLEDGFSLDTTFNVGDYLVTTAVCRHKLLLRRSTEVNPVIIGPSFMHKHRNEETYRWMASQLVSARPNIRKAKYFGTDGDRAMYVPFQQVLMDPLHLLCMIHFTDNMTRNISEHGMAAFTKVILDAIVGRREGNQRHKGYIDCETDDEYAQAEADICEMITSLHANGHVVANYFRIHKAPQLREHYSVKAQEAAGLRGKLYNTNAVESVNALLKRDVHRKRTPLQFAEDVENLVEKQKTEYEFALLGKGELVLVPEYKNLEIPFKRYTMMTADQKAAAIKRIHTEAYDLRKQIPELVELDDPDSMLLRSDHGRKLAEIESISHEVLLGILRTAEKILQTKNPVSQAPGPIRSRYLVAKGSSLTEVVVDEEATEVKCSKDCQSFILYGFCPDVVTVAISQNRLDVVVKWANSDKVKKSNKFGLFHLTKSNAPTKVGQKPRGTAVRKGPTQRPEAITEILPTQSWPTASSSRTKRPYDLIDDDEPKVRLVPPLRKSVTYSAAVHKSELWRKIKLQALGAKPQPNIAEYEVWFLDQVDARTTKCSGCDRPFRKDKDSQPEPPNDAVFVTCGKRKYWKKGEQEVSKSGNIYFHLQKVCLNDGLKKMEIADLANSSFVTSAAVKIRLTEEHESRLWAAIL